MTSANGGAQEPLARVRASVAQLDALLNMLYGRPESPDVITLDDVLFRYRLTELGQPAMTAIDQSRRMVRAIGDYEKIGLCEFHIGLIFLHWGDGRGAAQQFMAAQQQWSFTDHTAAVCLAYFAAGVAQRHVFEHEKAMRQFGKVKQLISRIPLAPITVAGNFAESLREAVDAARAEIRDEMWPPTLMGGQANIAPPQSRLGVSDPASLPNLQLTEKNGRPHWFRVISPMHLSETQITEGDWLLINTGPQTHDFFENELIVFTSEAIFDTGTWLTPQKTGETTVRFYLAQTQFSGKLTGQTIVSVKLNDDEVTSIESAAIIGPLAGIWRPINP